MDGTCGLRVVSLIYAGFIRSAPGGESLCVPSTAEENKVAAEGIQMSGYAADYATPKGTGTGNEET